MARTAEVWTGTVRQVWFGGASRGQVRLGSAWQARRGEATLGLVWRGMAGRGWSGSARKVLAQCGLARQARHGEFGRGEVRSGKAGKAGQREAWHGGAKHGRLG